MKCWSLLNAIKGLHSAARRLWAPRTNAEVDDLVKMCQNIGCKNIILFDGIKAFALEFPDPISTSGYRLVSVSPCHDSQLVVFSIATIVEFRNRRVPDELLPLIDARNKRGEFYFWLTRESESVARLSVRYTAPMAGMNASVIRTICENLCGESVWLDMQFHDGWIL